MRLVPAATAALSAADAAATAAFTSLATCAAAPATAASAITRASRALRHQVRAVWLLVDSRILLRGRRVRLLQEARPRLFSVPPSAHGAVRERRVLGVSGRLARFAATTFTDRAAAIAAISTAHAAMRRAP